MKSKHGLWSADTWGEKNHEDKHLNRGRIARLRGVEGVVPVELLAIRRDGGRGVAPRPSALEDQPRSIYAPTRRSRQTQ